MVASLFYTTFAPDLKKTVHELTKLNEIVMKKRILKIIVSVLIAALTALATSLGLNSCNVVRTVTNRSEYWQKGDTSVMIQTKTVESYDAKKNGL